MADESENSLKWAIIIDALRAAAGFGMAWVAWQMFSPIWFFFGFLAGCCAFGGAICAGKVLFNTGKLILSRRRLVKFKAKGVDPKADPMATGADLKKRGLLK